MKCFLTIATHNPSECLKSECSIWNNDRCLVVSFLQGYIKQQLFTLEMLKISRKLQKRVDNDIEGEEDD